MVAGTRWKLKTEGGYLVCLTDGKQLSNSRASRWGVNYWFRCNIPYLPWQGHVLEHWVSLAKQDKHRRQVNCSDRLTWNCVFAPISRRKSSIMSSQKCFVRSKNGLQHDIRFPHETLWYYNVFWKWLSRNEKWYVLAEGISSNNFNFLFTVIKTTDTNNASLALEADLNLLHKRLVHVFLYSFCDMARYGVVEGILLDKNNALIRCKGCVYKKFTRGPIPNTQESPSKRSTS